MLKTKNKQLIITLTAITLLISIPTNAMAYDARYDPTVKWTMNQYINNNEAKLKSDGRNCYTHNSKSICDTQTDALIDGLNEGVNNIVSIFEPYGKLYYSPYFKSYFAENYTPEEAYKRLVATHGDDIYALWSDYDTKFLHGVVMLENPYKQGEYAIPYEGDPKWAYSHLGNGFYYGLTGIKSSHTASYKLGGTLYDHLKAIESTAQDVLGGYALHVSENPEITSSNDLISQNNKIGVYLKMWRPSYDTRIYNDTMFNSLNDVLEAFCYLQQDDQAGVSLWAYIDDLYHYQYGYRSTRPNSSDYGFVQNGADTSTGTLTYKDTGAVINYDFTNLKNYKIKLFFNPKKGV